MIKLTDKEKESHIMIKKLIDKKPIDLLNKNFVAGKLILFHYSPKDIKNPYDNNPLCFVIGNSGKYIYGLNFNWIPPFLRKGIMNLIISKNKKNIREGKDFEIPGNLLKKIFKLGVPAFRKYLKNRISKKGVIVPNTSYLKVIDLRAEHFIGISSDKAWKIAIKRKG